MSEKSVYQKYRELGRCANCGKRLIGDRKGKTLCTVCARKHTEYIRENRKFYLENRLCPICGKEKLEGDERNCPECRCKKWIYKTNYLNSHPEQVEKKNENNRNRYKFRKENNLCVGCGCELKDQKYSNCEKCRIKRRMIAQRHREKGNYGV